MYERLKQYAARMEVISIRDLDKKHAMKALQKYRKRYRKEIVDDSLAERIYDKVGGRLAFLNRVAKSSNMIDMCDKIIQQEKTWLLNQCGLLGGSMDDDGNSYPLLSIIACINLSYSHEPTEICIIGYGSRKKTCRNGT